jgi:hypothetical protein
MMLSEINVISQKLSCLSGCGRDICRLDHGARPVKKLPSNAKVKSKNLSEIHCRTGVVARWRSVA